jgi:hypothetical protein
MTSTSTPVTARIPVATAGTSVASWLLPTPSDARVRLEKVVMQATVADERRGRPLRTLGAVARRALTEEVEAKLRMVMSDTLADLIVGGWRAYGAVRRVIEDSRSRPGVDYVLPLRNHTIMADRQHSLDIEVDGFQVMTLSVQLVIRVQLCDAVAVVRDGQLVAVRSGQAKANGTVTVEGVQVAQRSMTFPVTAELALHASRHV